MVHHVAGRGGHVAGLTHVVLVLPPQSVLSLVQVGLLRHLVLVLDTFTVVREEGGQPRELAEMALEFQKLKIIIRILGTDREDRINSGLPAHLLAS